MGVYTVLFIISIHVLVHRQDCPNRGLYMFFTIGLFALTSAINTVDTVLDIRQATLDFGFTKNQDWASFAAFLQHDDLKTITVGLQGAVPLCLVQDFGKFNATPPLLHNLGLI
ncbi:hypothetical protein MPER_10667 [Moniliophthora perniciosa FA553]|nr:hypothetical protein MPER_10667 [Moniliophthora perniciosa FA553]